MEFRHAGAKPARGEGSGGSKRTCFRPGMRQITHDYTT